MSSSVNKVILVGNLGRDPEIRTTQSGAKVASLAVATSERWRDRNSGELREKTEWHRVSIFNEVLVKVAENYLKKGSKIYLEGQIQTRKWTDANGQEHYTTEILLSNYRSELVMLDSRAGISDEQSGSLDSAASVLSPASRAASVIKPPSPREPSRGKALSPADDTFDDDIPF